MAYKPPKPSFCDLHPDAIAFYEEWIEYKREVKVERETAWYTWLSFGMMQRTITKIIIHETQWRIDHYCNGSSSEKYVVQQRSYIDDENVGFAFVWDTLIGDDPARPVGPRRSYDVTPSELEDITDTEPNPKSPVAPVIGGEVIDDAYVERLKERQRGEHQSHGDSDDDPDSKSRIFKEDIIVRENLAGEGYVRILGTAKHKAEPIVLTKGSTVDGDMLPHEFYDIGGIADGRYIVEYVGVTPAPRYGENALVLTIKIRETY